jgi:hypothetical protein
MRPPDDPDAVEYFPYDHDFDPGPSLLRMAIVRLVVMAVMVGAVWLGLREWHTATVVLVVVGAAWLLGRVD